MDEGKKDAGKRIFTRTESRVLLFLTIVAFIGILAYYLRYRSNSSEYKEFEYKFQDSLFAISDSVNNFNLKPENFLKKKVDINPESLDFSDNKLPGREKSKNSLREKSININKADVKTLMRLPGIGIKTAKTIIEFRKSRGKFLTIEELLEVKGIKEAKFNKIKNYIFIDEKNILNSPEEK